MSSPTIRSDVKDRIATITIDRPAAKNALGPAEWAALAEAVPAATAAVAAATATV